MCKFMILANVPGLNRPAGGYTACTRRQICRVIQLTFDLHDVGEQAGLAAGSPAYMNSVRIHLYDGDLGTQPVRAQGQFSETCAVIIGGCSKHTSARATRGCGCGDVGLLSGGHKNHRVLVYVSLDPQHAMRTLTVWTIDATDLG
jgi:hypothetical protein